MMIEKAPSQPEAEEIFRRLDALQVQQGEFAPFIGLDADKISKVRRGVRRFTATEVVLAHKGLTDREAARDAASEAAEFRATRVASDRVPYRPEPDLPDARGVDSGDTAAIMKLDLRLPMGPGLLVDDYIAAEPIYFDMGYIRAFTRTPPNRLRIASGIGDSMFPTLQSADSVWIDTTQNALAHQDRIYAVSIYGAATIKRLRRIGGGRVLVYGDNPTMRDRDQEVDEDDLLIGGMIIHFSRDV